MSGWLLSSIIQWLACVAVCLPLVAVGFGMLEPYKRVEFGRTLAWLAGFLLAALLLVRSSLGLNILPSPWQGMIFEAALALAVILATRRVAANGLTMNISRRAWRAALTTTALLAAFVALRAIGLKILGRADSSGSLNPEYFLYLLTMPGIAEELVYRGVIQSWLNGCLPRPWNFAGAPLGLGFVITAVVFWAVHAFIVIPPAQISFYWPTVTLQLIVGLGFGWLRERTGSIVPGILAHNLVNILRALF